MSGFFKDTKKGSDLFELKQKLSHKDDKQKIDAVKKIISAMTTGKDVSNMFPNVVMCIQTRNLELKKLVYLYVLNYAKSQPDLAILAVSTFEKDTTDSSPLIRGLAIRTMGCIRVASITEHLCEPLKRCLKDDDAYVRKTAALCVAKLFDMDQNIVRDHGFLDLLKNLLSDGNAPVVANAVAALVEMQGAANSPTTLFEVNTAILAKLLGALDECTEWGQIYIMDALGRYTPVDTREAESVVERVTPKLNHRNSAVTLSAIRVLMRYLEVVTSQDFIRSTCKRMSQPLVSLLNDQERSYEIQYVALKNMNLIIQKRPSLLTSLQHVRMLFCKYNDPIYVKLEKLEILVKVTNNHNIASILPEFKTYAEEVDVPFVRKAVRAIGRCAIKLERSTQKCIEVLDELIKTKVNYVVQEAIIVIKDIFRRYPNRYESIIATLCDNLEELDEAEAKASMIWIVGQYAERIDNAEELLQSFLETFHEEVAQVQLALLTATVKLFLKKPQESQQAMVQQVLQVTTESTDNPDLRDRGYLYWRLLADDPEVAKRVVLSEKPLISDDSGRMDDAFLDLLLQQIGSLSSIYYKLPEMFEMTNKAPEEWSDDDDDRAARAASRAVPYAIPAAPEEDVVSPPAPADEGPRGGDSSDDDRGVSVPAVAAGHGNLIDLGLDGPMASQVVLDPLAAAPARQPERVLSPMEQLGQVDLLGGALGGLSVGAQPEEPIELLMEASKAKGMQISGAIRRREGKIFFDLLFENKALSPLTGFMVVFNKNSFGLAPGAPLAVPDLAPNQSARTSLPITTDGPMALMTPLTALQVAVRNNLGDFYFQATAPFFALCVEGAAIDRKEFLRLWQAIPASAEHVKELADLRLPSVDALVQQLEARNVPLIARKDDAGQAMVYMSLRTTNGISVLLEFTLTLSPSNSVTAARVAAKSSQPVVVPVLYADLEKVLRR